MKRNSVPTIILLIASYLTVGVVLGGVIDVLLNLPRFSVFTIFMAEIVLLFFPNISNLIMFPVAKKTMMKGIKENNFGKTTTYVGGGWHRIKSMICIDEETGRVAYTSALSPFKFQMVEAKELSKARSTYERGPLGGTRYVFFEFYYKNNRIRIPTLYSSKFTYFIASREVQEALATGENICKLIEKFNPLVRLTADKITNREMPFIKIGVPSAICGGLSIYVAVMGIFTEIYVSSFEGWKDDFLNSAMPAFVVVSIALALAVAGLVFGIMGLRRAATEAPVRGLGLSKAGTVMSAIVIVVLLLKLALFIIG
ncbi:MAG: hypothetical protein Q4C15_07625 [Eubacteriales bacterium]|nr:hypothetical protein [Eubacteriales bacterium]